MTKKKINDELRSPRNKLLYFLYCAPKSRIKDEAGARAKMCQSLGFSSDGLFYYHLDHLTETGLIEQKNGYIAVTDEGKLEFRSTDTLSTFGLATVGIGISFFFWYVLFKLGYLNAEGVLGAGSVIVFIGFILYIQGKRVEPRLPPEARDFLKDLKKKR